MPPKSEKPPGNPIRRTRLRLPKKVTSDKTKRKPSVSKKPVRLSSRDPSVAVQRSSAGAIGPYRNHVKTGIGIGATILALGVGARILNGRKTTQGKKPRNKYVNLPSGSDISVNLSASPSNLSSIQSRTPSDTGLHNKRDELSEFLNSPSNKEWISELLN